MKSTLLWILLIVLFGVILIGCSSAEKTEPAVVEEETAESPAEGSGTTPAEGANTNETPATPTEEGSGTVEGEKSTATKTGEAVGGALKTAGEATGKGVKTGVDATVKGAKTVGNATKDVVVGAADAVKGDKEKP